MANITTTAVDVMIPEVLAKEVYHQFQSKLVAPKLVVRKDADVKGMGDSVRIPFISRLTAQDKTAGTSVTPQANTETSVVVNVDKHKVAAVRIEDIAELQSKQNLKNIYLKELADALRRQLETDTLAASSNFDNTVDATSTGITKAKVLEARRVLQAEEVPFEGDVHLLVDAYGWEDLLNVDDFVRYDATGQAGKNSPIKTGEVGTIYGINVYPNEYVPYSAGTVTAPLFHREAIALAIQQNVKVETQRQALALATDVVASILYGVKALRTDAGVKLQYSRS